jgi:hypothetical protein
MGFIPSKAEADIWMTESNNLYEYIAVYVDDPKEIVQKLDLPSRM